MRENKSDFKSFSDLHVRSHTGVASPQEAHFDFLIDWAVLLLASTNMHFSWTGQLPPRSWSRAFWALACTGTRPPPPSWSQRQAHQPGPHPRPSLQLLTLLQWKPTFARYEFWQLQPTQIISWRKTQEMWIVVIFFVDWSNGVQKLLLQFSSMEAIASSERCWWTQNFAKFKNRHGHRKLLIDDAHKPRTGNV